MKVLAFVGTPGGGDSALVAYNLAWMYAHMGLKTLCVDLTTSARLSEMFFTEAQLADFWPLDAERGYGFFGPLWPLLSGDETSGRPSVHRDHSLLARDLRILAGADDDPTFEDLRRRLAVVVGDPAAARFHEPFERAWFDATMEREQRLAVVLACQRLIHQRAQEHGVGMVVVDLGSEISPLTRAGLVPADASVVVTAPAPAARRGFQAFERLLPTWREHWSHLAPASNGGGAFADPIGAVDIDMRPRFAPPPRCLARLRFLRTLEPLSRESGKPIFMLAPSDGAMGGFAAAVFDARRELRDLAREIARRADVALPSAGESESHEEKP